MTTRYVLSPEAADDLSAIWEYVAEEATVEVAEYVANAILDKISFLSSNPGAGHSRIDLTDKPVKFFPVFS